MATAQDHVVELVRHLEDRRYDAMIAGDVETLDLLLSDELAYGHSSGERDTKPSYLDRVRNGTFVYTSIEHPVDKVIVTGSAAVVVGIMIALAHVSGELKTIHGAALAVWAEEDDGQWRLVAYQPTPIVPR
jgi:ketosteroid isomerase-like protein